MSYGDMKGNASAKGRGFPPGVSGNPGGKPKIAAMVEAATGKSVSEASADVIGMLYREAMAGDVKAAELFLVRTLGKPKETVEIQQPLSDEQYREELRLIAREQLRAMPAEERYRMLAELENPAPSNYEQ